MQTEKQRERLVELLDNLPNGELRTKDVADYLMSNNVVVLPCVVGQKVWCICNYEKPKEFQVEVLSVSENHYSFTIGANKGVFRHYCDKGSVGKWVFFTKEEAEAKLREMRDGT